MLALLVFALGLAASYQWLRYSDRLARERAQVLAADLAADHAQSLQRGMERALSATYAIAALVRQAQGQVRVQDFEGVASEMLPFYPGIVALGIAPGGIICCVVPRQGNEKSIGFNQLTDAAQNNEARRARDTGRLTLAGPLQLAQGGLGVVGRLPIFLTDGLGQRTFWGFSYVTLRFPEALESARLSLLPDRGYAYELWRTDPESGRRQRIDAWSERALVDPVERTLELPNGAWTLSVAPIQGWRNKADLTLEAAIGLLISVLLGYLAWLLYAMRLRDTQLEALVEQRTHEIRATQQHLEATMNAALRGGARRALLQHPLPPAGPAGPALRPVAGAHRAGGDATRSGCRGAAGLAGGKRKNLVHRSADLSAAGDRAPLVRAFGGTQGALPGR